MNKTASIIIFIILAVAIIVGAVWYSNQMSSGGTVVGQGTMDQSQTANQTSTNATTTNMAQDQLQIKDLTVGTGAEAKNGDTVSVLYTGTLDDGTVFDASANHGNTPFSFTLGAGQVIKGWDEGVLGMKVGGKRELVIPASLGYGAQGAGGVIPPNATLHFTVELLRVGQ
jgi:peptidylprolyl isomerase